MIYNMNGTYCKDCAKADVCKYQEEFNAADEAIRTLSWCADGNKVILLPDSQLIEVIIKCKKYAPNHGMTRKA